MKKFTKPYIDQVATVTKPHVEKARVILKPYTKKIVRTHNKFVKAATMYHRQVFTLFLIFMTFVQTISTFSSDFLKFVFMPSRIFSPLIVVYAGTIFLLL